ncbi:MAG: glycosyltransferase family 39 protein [Ignavibacteria bacterium]|nr:glycosyltransferase family 39 protein [Ignavibacteria bacterium]
MNAKKEKILLLSLFIFCLAIRIAFITQKNLWFDEVFSWHLSLTSFYDIIVSTANDIHPPLYYFTLKIWNFVFGDSVFSMRLLSALFTSGAVFFLYPISRRFMEPMQAILVVLLYSFSPLNLYYSQEVRMSAMNLFLNLGSIYFLMNLTDKIPPAAGFYRNRTAICYILFTAAALYTHYFSFFILIAQLIFILYCYIRSPKELRTFLYIFASIAVLYLVWIPDLLTHFTRGQSWRTPQNISSVIDEYLNYTKDLSLGLYYYYADYRVMEYLKYFIYFFFAASIAVVSIKRKPLQYKYLNLVLLAVFVPLLLAGILSFNQKIEFYRYLSILVPYISIMIVYGLMNFVYRPAGIVILAMFMVINIYGIRTHFNFDFKNDDYRALISDVESKFTPGERIYVQPHYNGWVIDYYKKQEHLNLPATAFVRYGWGEVMDSITVQKPESFWVVLDYSAVDTSKYASYRNELNSRFNEVSRNTYFLAPAKVELYRFTKKF